ncbi:MAG: hypothetical protein PHC28_07075 [Flavobacterium sp.]|uniref:hypothetical protein n=1 Tax=Flavobacterium sp. TaxID=239 RepID=UPI0026210979|nr:hypothetical protein [Flavobacterium sp.]MDD5150233.1 hypothetical protein [Flavobacterium sp.]
MENLNVQKFASDYLAARLNEYEMYCITKQIRLIHPTEIEKDALFKYLLDQDVWNDFRLSREFLIEKIDSYYVKLTLLSVPDEF